MGTTALHGTMPDGTAYDVRMAPGLIVCRVNEETCIAHDRWMTRAQLVALHGALAGILNGWPDPTPPPPPVESLIGRQCDACGMVSWHPTDLATDYCANCHGVTEGHAVREKTIGEAAAEMRERGW